jgi:hypothetical protein
MLKNDKMELVQKYEALKNKQDSTMTVLQNKEKFRGVSSQREISTNYTHAENIKSSKSKEVIFANLTVETYTANKGLTKMNPTMKSDAVNFCKVKFLIRGNSSVDNSKGKYYVQIIDPNGDVIGKRLSRKFGSIVLDYSYDEEFSYNGENLEETSGLPLADLVKGNYTIYLFKNDKIALKSGFTLI